MKNEKTLVLIKPDGVQRGLIGEIIERFERTGLKLAAMKMVLATDKQCWTHYNKDEKWFLEKGAKIIADRKANGLTVEKDALDYGKEIVEHLVKFMTSGPIVAMIWQGNKSVGIVKKLVGATEPLASDVGTIRGDFTLDSYDLAAVSDRAVRNLIHCSDKPEEAEREINVWFAEKEIINYRLVQEQIIYDVNLDGISE